MTTISILTYKRDFLSVAKILIYPCGFMSLIALFYSFTEDFRVHTLILSIWGFYQTFLLWQAIRQNCTRMLPLFQLLQGGLRAEAHRRRHSSHIRDMTKTLGPPQDKVESNAKISDNNTANTDTNTNNINSNDTNASDNNNNNNSDNANSKTSDNPNENGVSVNVNDNAIELQPSTHDVNHVQQSNENTNQNGADEIILSETPL
ncbi:hypothetical protein RFI_14243 [Reticulomyxa filosa]|uniref:Uncharacterized protein n=1 Tax=Reticulomyxa filosa TaxID=46433 RepID=X6NB20_RETFI|nr:hypothetical protein RFI_36014 [Reticulomyxa filosa]ETO22949.1 hypothetical protein RFI_14243 [Reticulomyxa filosa]|eukprot:ETO01422.1 hypothetical protein RFI_36014 [Reticulomyxa filosa]